MAQETVFNRDNGRILPTADVKRLVDAAWDETFYLDQAPVE